MTERLSTLQNMRRDVEHSVLGMFLKLVLRVHGGFRENMVSEIAGRVTEQGYIDELSQDELDLLPKRAKREAYHQINMGLIPRVIRGSKWLKL